MSVANKPWGVYALSVICVLTGLSFQAIIMTCNLLQGASIGQDNASHLIFGGLAVLVDVGFIILSIARGYHLRIGKKWAARKCGFVAFVFGSISLVMFCGYGATNRLEPTRQAQLEYKAALDAANQSNAMSAGAASQLQSFLEKQAERAAEEARKKGMNTDQRTVAATEHKTILETMKEATKVEIKAAPVEKTPDAWAANMSRFTGLDVSTIQTMLLAVMGIGAIFMSSFMIRMGVMIYPDATPAAPVLSKAANDHTQNTSLDTVLSAHEQVRRFFSKNTRSDPTAEVVAQDMHRAYMEWAAAQHYHPILTSQGFGAAVTALRAADELDLERYHRGGSVQYKGKIPFNLKKPPKRVPKVRETPVAAIRLASARIAH